MRARFRVVARLDSAGRATEGTVSIDRSSLLFTVRPLRRRRAYTLHLGDVATLVVQALLKREAAERRNAKRRPRLRLVARQSEGCA